MTPANENHPTYVLTGAWNGFVIRDGKGRVVGQASKLSIAARMLGELQSPREAVRTMLTASLPLAQQERS